MTWPRTAIPLSTGAILVFIGFLMLFTGYFVSVISEYPDLMIQIINKTNLSFGTIFLAYMQIPISIGFIIIGIYVIIFSDNKAELPTQKIHPNLIKKEFKEMGKVPIRYKLAWVFLSGVFVQASVICLIGMKIIPSTKFDISIIVSVFLFLILGILLEKKPKVENKNATLV